MCTTATSVISSSTVLQSSTPEKPRTGKTKVLQCVDLTRDTKKKPRPRKRGYRRAAGGGCAQCASRANATSLMRRQSECESGRTWTKGGAMRKYRAGTATCGYAPRRDEFCGGFAENEGVPTLRRTATKGEGYGRGAAHLGKGCAYDRLPSSILSARGGLMVSVSSSPARCAGSGMWALSAVGAAWSASSIQPAGTMHGIDVATCGPRGGVQASQSGSRDRAFLGQTHPSCAIEPRRRLASRQSPDELVRERVAVPARSSSRQTDPHAVPRRVAHFSRSRYRVPCQAGSRRMACTMR